MRGLNESEPHLKIRVWGVDKALFFSLVSFHEDQDRCSLYFKFQLSLIWRKICFYQITPHFRMFLLTTVLVTRDLSPQAYKHKYLTKRKFFLLHKRAERKNPTSPTINTASKALEQILEGFPIRYTLKPPRIDFLARRQAPKTNDLLRSLHTTPKGTNSPKSICKNYPGTELASIQRRNRTAYFPPENARVSSWAFSAEDVATLPAACMIHWCATIKLYL